MARTAASMKIAASLPDEQPPAPDRQRELRRAREDGSAGESAPPYGGVQIRTLGELRWILQNEGWSGSPFVGGMRADLREVNLSGADLRAIELAGADLSGADLSRADVRGADLSLANLSGAFLAEGLFSGVDFYRANLTGASLFGTLLDGAHLRGANIGHADLSEADLRGASLRGGRMDEATVLSGAKFDATTRVGEVVWNGASLSQVTWPSCLGDEMRISFTKGRRHREKACRDAAQAYRSLAQSLRQQGLIQAASRFRLREQRLEQKARFLRGPLAWPQCIFFQVLDWVSAYGEQPWRTFVAYVLSVVAFTGIYLYISSTTASPLNGLEALVLSVSSFHGRGFFPTTLHLDDPMALAAGAEAVLGLFIELIFIATFSRRFLGS